METQAIAEVNEENSNKIAISELIAAGELVNMPSTDTTRLTRDFPVSFRGYNRQAVDSFVSEIGARLSELQVELEETKRRTDVLESVQRQVDAKTIRIKELESALAESDANLSAFISKEQGIANALVSIERRRVEVENEIELLEIEGRKEAEQIVDEAQMKVNEMLAETERAARERIALAELACDVQEDRLRALCTEYDNLCERIRATIRAQMNLLPIPGDTLSSLSLEDKPASRSSLPDLQRDALEAQVIGHKEEGSRLLVSDIVGDEAHSEAVVIDVLENRETPVEAG